MRRPGTDDSLGGKFNAHQPGVDHVKPPPAVPTLVPPEVPAPKAGSTGGCEDAGKDGSTVTQAEDPAAGKEGDGNSGAGLTEQQKKDAHAMYMRYFRSVRSLRPMGWF